ncbi:MAG: hypothetical protein R3F20_09145 [Planctomycetota bacterium]
MTEPATTGSERWYQKLTSPVGGLLAYSAVAFVAFLFCMTQCFSIVPNTWPILASLLLPLGGLVWIVMLFIVGAIDGVRRRNPFVVLSALALAVFLTWSNWKVDDFCVWLYLERHGDDLHRALRHGERLEGWSGETSKSGERFLLGPWGEWGSDSARRIVFDADGGLVGDARNIDAEEIEQRMRTEWLDVSLRLGELHVEGTSSGVVLGTWVLR